MSQTSKKILILTQYFPPETGAPQNRLYSIANHLGEFGAEVTVLTALPSYPKSEIYDGYKGKWFVKEREQNMTIIHGPIFVSKSKSIVSRLLNYFSFVFTSLFIGLFLIKKQDIIICESPPLFLGITALLLKWIKRSKLIFNVSDLWPLSAVELEIIHNKFLLNLSYKLEKILYFNSDLVSGQTQGIIDDIKGRYPTIPLHLMRNGIDTKQFGALGNRNETRVKYGLNNDDFVIAYAGIIGHAQGFEIIIETAKLIIKDTHIKFLLVGDGPVKEKTMESAKQFHLSNIIFGDSVPRNKVPDIIAACDCYVTPLRNNKLFLGAIPSKIFEPLYYGKPILMGVNGEAKQLFVEEGKCALHFEPENPNALVKAIYQISQDKSLYDLLSKNGKEYVLANFNREKLALEFWNKINSL